MNRDQFIKRLKAMLFAQGVADTADILGDYEEHFRAGIEAGKTEEEIAQELGDPEELAMTFAEDRRAQNGQVAPGAQTTMPPQWARAEQEKQSASATQDAPKHAAYDKTNRALAIFGLFWLDLCVVFPAWVTLISLCISLFVTFLAVAGVAVLLFVNVFPFEMPFLPDLARIFLGVSMCGLSALSFAGFLGLCKGTSHAGKAFARWHRKAAKGGVAA